MSKSQVSIVKTGMRPDYDAVLAAVRKSIDLIGGLDDLVNSDQIVLINPSWVAAPADKETGSCTWPLDCSVISSRGIFHRRARSALRRSFVPAPG